MTAVESRYFLRINGHPPGAGFAWTGVGFWVSSINRRYGWSFSDYMIPASYKPKKKFMQLAIAEAKRARDRGDYAIGAVITRVVGKREVVIASAGNRVKTSGSSIKHVE